MKKKKTLSKEKILANLLSGRAGKKYQGKQVIIFGNEVYILPEDDQKSASLVDQLIKKYPQAKPTITYVPCQGTYILFLKT